MSARITDKERVVLNGAFKSLYENGEKMMISTLPPGTVILSCSKDDLVEEGDPDEFIYQILVIYRVSAKEVLCAHFNSDLFPETGFGFDAKQMVVVLGDHNSLARNRQTIGKPHSTLEGLRLSVQTRTNSIVLYRSGDDSDVLFLTNVRHGKDGTPLGGYVVNGGYNITLRRGLLTSFWDSKNPARKQQTPYFEVLYVDAALRKKAAKRRLGYLEYDEVFEHMKTVPKRFRIKFQMPQATK